MGAWCRQCFLRLENFLLQNSGVALKNSLRNIAKSCQQRAHALYPRDGPLRCRFLFHRQPTPSDCIRETFSFGADLSRLRRSRVPNLARVGTLELAK
jgi:hypothetical protein